MYQDHPDNEVRSAIIRLSDALCSWERSTGRESVLIIREQGGYCYRALSGKPTIPDDMKDSQLVQMIANPPSSVPCPRDTLCCSQ